MKILLLHGQSHKQISYHIGRKLIDKLAPDQLYEFFLPKDMPHFCNGCCQCMNEGMNACPHYKEMKPLLDALEVCDVYIFTTPVYCGHTTASMKAFLDHCFVYWHPHRPQAYMYKKKAIIVSVGAGSGMKKAAKDIKDSFVFWGISDVFIMTQRGQAPSWKDVSKKVLCEIEQKTDKIVHTLRKQEGRYHVSFKIKIIFYAMRFMQKKGWEACAQDRLYWEENGWLQSARPWK